jgi:hypothetical protein
MVHDSASTNATIGRCPGDQVVHTFQARTTMTQPQPQQSNGSLPAGDASTTLSYDKCQSLRHLLYDVPLPKTSKATTCVISLEKLHQARSFIDSILMDPALKLAAPLTTLSAKINELSTQLEDMKSHTRSPHVSTGISTSNTNDMHTTNRWPPRSFSAVAAMKVPLNNRQTKAKQSRSDAKPQATARQSQVPPTYSSTSKRIIVQFTSGAPKPNERRSPTDLRDSVNEALIDTHIQVVGVQFTRAGHIAITPRLPCTTDMLLQHSDIFGPCVAHKKPFDDLAFEHNRSWYSLVVSAPMPRFRHTNEEVEEEMVREMQEWNMTRLNGIKGARILCRPEELWKKTRGSLLVSFEAFEEYQEAIREGIFIYGEQCKTAPYKSRHFSEMRISEQVS